MKSTYSGTRLYFQIIIVLTVLLVLALVAIIKLSFTNADVVANREKIVVPMAFDSPFVISENSVSAAYLQQVAMSFVPMRLNVTPETVATQHQFVLKWVRPEQRPDMKKTLSDEEANIKANSVSTAFILQGIKAYPDDLVVDVTGEIYTWVSSGKPTVDTGHFRLQLQRVNGALYLKSFEKVVKNVS